MSTPDDKLFEQVSKAMQEGDSVKLSELLAQESPQDEEQPESEQPEEEVEAPAEEEEQEEQQEQEPSDEDGEDKEEAKEEDKKDDDPIAQLRAEIEYLKKTTQSHSSQVGRVSSLQRRLSEYDRQLAALREATSGKTSEKVKPKLDEALKDLEETDPVLANTLKSVLTNALNEVDSNAVAQEEKRIQALRETDYESYRAEQYNLLIERVPNAPDVFKSESWKNWKKSQEEHVLDLATSDSASAVIMALDLYKRDMLAAHPELAPKPKDEAAVERARQVEESRKRQQQTTPQVPSGKAPSSKKGPIDEQALFNKFSEDIRKDIRGQ